MLKDQRLKKVHKDILLEHRYKPQNWWLISEDDSYFTIQHKKGGSVRRFSKINKSEITRGGQDE